MTMKKRLLPLLLGLALLGACSPKPTAPTATPAPSAAATPEPTPTPTPTPVPERGEPVRVAMLKGPTGLGGAKLMLDSANAAQYDWSPEAAGLEGLELEFSVLADPTEAVAGLSGGSLDIAALPTNLASTLYHKTGGGVQLLCLNTLGTLYILENGSEVASLADLAGKTLDAYGQGANPEYVLGYLLGQEGLSLEDVDIRWSASTDEIAARMASGEAGLCMLPVPAATTVLMQNSGVSKAVSLNDAWRDSGAEGVLTMGCLVARTEFVQAHPEAVERFLAAYEESIAYMTDPANLDTAAALAEQFAIVPKAAVAKAALPDANLCFLTGEEMIAGVQGYYQVLFDADPKSIGGSFPDSAFYYGYDG